MNKQIKYKVPVARPFSPVPRNGTTSQPFLSGAPLKLLPGPWTGFAEDLTVAVLLSWEPRALHLHWQVRESGTRARYTQDNDPVYEDSCVEVFMRFPGSEAYINIECNAIGTILAARGEDRIQRTPWGSEEIARISRKPSLGFEPFEEKSIPGGWTLDMVIPAAQLIPGFGPFEPGLRFAANFYKCGDALSQPHYYTWAPVSSKRPDFHRPGCFGTLQLS